MREIVVSLSQQTLTLSGDEPRRYDVSTSANGAGEIEGSEKTPRGLHCIHAKIGAGAPAGTVFKGRQPTGEIYSEALARAAPRRDWILTRILWLAGCEPGKNKGGCRDTLSRYIYIHGSPDSAKMGVPGSIGCIRMSNRDVMELFDLAQEGAPVNIIE